MENALNKMLNGMDEVDEESKLAYKQWWEQSKKHVEIEAQLTYWRNNLHIRLKPTLHGRKERRDGTLHGTYEACIEDDNGNVRIVEVADDWVHANISGEAIEIIHRVSDDVHTLHADKTGRVDYGFVSILNYEGEDTEGQISKIRYIPPKTKM